MVSTAAAACCWFMEQVSDLDVYIHGAAAILCSKKTRYQQMYIVETPTMGKVLILDNKIQSATVDEFLYHEPLVHPACFACGSPRRVLVLGGGEGAPVREVLRWKTVEQVVMVDIDRDVVGACEEMLPEMHSGAFRDPRTNLIFSDALAFLEASTDRWDVIISDLTEPIEGGPSFNLFTKEFFVQARSRLTPSGVFVLQAGPVGPQYMGLYARLARTMKAVFPHILAYGTSVPSYPAPWGFVLGSMKPLESRPQPNAIDEVLATKTSGGFRMLDGEALLGLLQTPLYVRKAIESEKQIFTVSEPPRFIGQGSVG